MKLRYYLPLLVSSALCWYAASGPRPDGQLVEALIPAPSLKNNKLGDSYEQRVEIYLPPSYANSPDKRYPVLYLLHGFAGDSASFTRDGYQGMNLKDVMDTAIEEKKAVEMIVVVPNASDAYLGSFYTNSEVSGNWEDYIYREVVSYVDSKYRTLNDGQSRGVAGHSMGGYGSFMLGMKHPDTFGAVYSMSPCCMAMEADLGSENKSWSRTLALKSGDQIREPQTYDEFWSAVQLALSAALSPNPSKAPLYVDFPFAENNGNLVKSEPAYSKWQSQMPINLLSENKENLMKLKGIVIDVGEQEEFTHIKVGAALVSGRLAEAGIPHAFEIYGDGDHNSKIRERIETKVIPFFSKVFEERESRN